MQSLSSRTIMQVSRYKINRRSRKLPVLDEFKLMLALPKDVPERVWLELFQKEETDQLICDLLEDLVEDAMEVVYRRYMERQSILFTVDCATQAWLKVIDWYYFRHDPGEEPSAYPPCYIPKRDESWEPDEMPAFSVKDALAKQALDIQEITYDEQLRSWPSNDSIDMPEVECIPKEYWFPGKVLWPKSVFSESYSDGSTAAMMGAYSEVLQKITNYGSEETSSVHPEGEFSQELTESEIEMTIPSTPALTPDETASPASPPPSLPDLPSGSMQRTTKSKLSKTMQTSSFSSRSSRNKKILPPINKESPTSIISDCRLRYLRLDTQYDITSERVDSDSKDAFKRK